MVFQLLVFLCITRKPKKKLYSSLRLLCLQSAAKHATIVANVSNATKLLPDHNGTVSLNGRIHANIINHHHRHHLSVTGVVRDGATGGHALQSITLRNFKRINSENVQMNNAILAQFLTSFWRICIIFARSFPQGVIIGPSSQNTGTIANKFQFHTYFRFE